MIDTYEISPRFIMQSVIDYIAYKEDKKELLDVLSKYLQSYGFDTKQTLDILNHLPKRFDLKSVYPDMPDSWC